MPPRRTRGADSSCTSARAPSSCRPPSARRAGFRAPGAPALRRLREWDRYRAPAPGPRSRPCPHARGILTVENSFHLRGSEMSHRGSQLSNADKRRRPYNFRMDLRTLRYVTTAVRLESITKAAEQLHIAQSAVSRAIKQLEDELGVELLVRHTHGVKATPEGLKFVQSAETLLAAAKQLRDEMRSQSAAPTGPIRFGFPPSQGAHFIDVLVAGFVKKYPAVQFLLREGFSEALTQDLLADRLDVAILLYETRHQDLQRRPLFAEETWLVGEPAHWRFGTKPLSPRQLEGLSLVHTQLIGEALRKLTAKHKVNWNIVAQGDVTRVAREVVRTGAAYWLVTYGLVAEEIEKGTLVGVPVKGLEFRRGLFWRADRPRSRAVSTFIEELEQAVEALKLSHPKFIKEIGKG